MGHTAAGTRESVRGDGQIGVAEVQGHEVAPRIAPHAEVFLGAIVDHVGDHRRTAFGNADGNYSDPSVAFVGHRWFYPRGYMLPNGRILCVTRCQRDPTGVMWSEVFHSDDGGETWGFLSRVNDFGAPCNLVILPDGRVVAIYGYRLMPSGIRASVSEDGGKTWGAEIVVRDDGGSWDLGYPNSWLVDGNTVGTLYYFNSKDDRVQANGGVRHIARSIFSID